MADGTKIDDIGFAKVDLDRYARQGVAEVVYGEGKNAAQIAAILRSLDSHSQLPALVTRMSPGKAAAAAQEFGGRFEYFDIARTGRLGSPRPADGHGVVAVVCAGTSDIAVAEEAAVAAETFGNKVERIYDVGVAGIHRLMSFEPLLKSASVAIAVAGMDGALPSVVGGLVRCPVVAVPTSVGYGASFGGVAALLAMLNSCASGVVAVNIDNGFGAAMAAHRMNHIGIPR